MTELYPSDRILFSQLYEWLETYSEYILNLDPFECEQLPMIIKRTAEKNPIELSDSSPKKEGFLKNCEKRRLVKKTESQ